MSYLTSYGGAVGFGGFGYSALGSSFRIGPSSEPLRSLQRELVRLGYLQNDSGLFGADGLWGPRTALALRQAATYVRWADAPYSPPNADSLRTGTVDVPDDLIARIRAASPDPNASRAGADVPPSPEGSIDPVPDSTPPVTNGVPRRAPWVVPVAIGGVTLALVGALLLSGRKKRPASVTSNRRRARRRR